MTRTFFTQNGCRETHSLDSDYTVYTERKLLMQLTQQPESGPADEEMSVTNNVESIVIPRLRQIEVSQV